MCMRFFGWNDIVLYERKCLWVELYGHGNAEFCNCILFAVFCNQCFPTKYGLLEKKSADCTCFLTGFGIMALVIRFFGTSVSACMLAVLAIIGCFLFLANKITEVIELIKEGDSKNENDSIFEKGTE